jgi:hypothetical protein
MPDIKRESDSPSAPKHSIPLHSIIEVKEVSSKDREKKKHLKNKDVKAFKVIFDRTAKIKGMVHGAAGETSGDEDVDNPDDWNGDFEKKAGPNKDKTETWYFREFNKE